MLDDFMLRAALAALHEYALAVFVSPNAVDAAFAHLDAWPPAVLSHLSKPAPGSSLTWTIEFVHPIPSLTTHDWCLYQAEIEHALDGYGHIAARLWTADGQLLALSRQTTTVFD